MFRDLLENLHRGYSSALEVVTMEMHPKPAEYVREWSPYPPIVPILDAKSSTEKDPFRLRHPQTGRPLLLQKAKDEMLNYFPCSKRFSNGCFRLFLRSTVRTDYASIKYFPGNCRTSPFNSIRSSFPSASATDMCSISAITSIWIPSSGFNSP